MIINPPGDRNQENLMTTSPFCPHCQHYLGILSNCPHCRKQRSPIETPLYPGGVFWQVSLPGGIAKQFAFAQVGATPALIACWGSNEAQGAQTAGGVVAFALASGEKLWESNLRYTVEGGTAVAQDEGVALVGGLRRNTKLGNVVALNLVDGSVRWEDEPIAGVRGCPVIEPGTPRAYVIADDGLLRGYDLRSGNSLWRGAVRVFEHAPRVQAAPLLVSTGFAGLILASYSKTNLRQPGEIVAVDRRDGGIIWRKPAAVERVLTLGNVRDQPLLVDEKLFVSTFDDVKQRSGLLAMQASTGKPLWKQPFMIEAAQQNPRGLPYLVAAPLYVDGRLYVAGRDHHLYALNAANGQLLWKLPLPGGVAVAPLTYAGALLLADTRGSVYLIDPTQPRIVTTFPLKAANGSAPGILTNLMLVGDVLMVGASDGTVTALPWHLGAYEWAANAAKQRGNLEQAGDLLATAHAFWHTSAFAEAALDCWQHNRALAKMGYFALAQHQQRDAAAFLKQAALQTESVNPQEAVHLYRHAAQILAELRAEGESLNQCTQAMARLSRQAWVDIQVVNIPQCILGEKEEITLRLRNKSGLPVPAGMRVYASGALKAPSAAEIPVPLPPDEVWNLQIPIVATCAESDLTLEISHPGAAGERMPYLVVCKIFGKEPPPNYHFGDVGVLKLSIQAADGIAIACRDVGAIINKHGNAAVDVAGDVGYIGGG
ncbi:MAG: hypothetical protein OHK0052_17940 [Anaerolineales bacterium]